ncbi:MULTISPECIES: amidohydrolase family protein [unclassified Sinorhizobium]|uniref:amidohydrolase family protein n=1 Tax=unclassified Sinorhizobium TaxID=2613772 RepID=UPI0024C2114B|nr:MULTISPECIES: amidohydrolase family protein [unclassified Sinorhizobium]MDK1374078.1 amidohydrolase family protein [Sinorhizobium sp. 6-70]MDK1480671.1 amidohydrolase family protein [Sinorhizobium sp. 6-117]
MTETGTVIDGHVHFFTAADLARVAGQLPYTLPDPHTLTDYLAGLKDSGTIPTLLNNVHLSILPDSANVFASFEELAALTRREPERYGSVRLVGTIKADPAYADAEHLSHPQVVGVRIVLHDAPPDRVSSDAFSSAEWKALFGRLRPDQHVHVYAQEAETNLRVLRQIPASVRVLIDHLGTCHAERGIDEPAYRALLAEARRRGNVWFKGPGYRTSIEIETALPFVAAIIETLGHGRLLLQASDAPHVGTDAEGRNFAAHFTAASALQFTESLAQAAAQVTGIPADRLLRQAADEIFPVLKKAKP